MDTSCPYCEKDLAYKMLPRKSVGQKMGSAKISTPCCKFCKQPLVMNYPPRSQADVVKDLSVCLIAAGGFFASMHFSSPLILAISLPISAGLYLFFFKQKINEFAMVKKYTKLDVNDL